MFVYWKPNKLNGYELTVDVEGLRLLALANDVVDLALDDPVVVLPGDPFQFEGRAMIGGNNFVVNEPPSKTDYVLGIVFYKKRRTYLYDISLGLAWALQVKTALSPSRIGAWSTAIETWGAYSTSSLICAEWGTTSAGFWACKNMLFK